MKILDFLFGKSPKIFDRKGQVQHELPEDKWNAWQDRYMSDPEYNWRNHTGTRSKDDQKRTKH
jgi:hypothetical protein